MKTHATKFLGLIVVLLTATVSGRGETPGPIQGETVLASVNGEWITLDDLITQVGTLHSGMGEQPQAMIDTPDPSAFLERMVNVQLVVQEARNIGLDQLPEVAAQLEAVRLNLIKEAVIDERMKNLAHDDPAEVERLYRDAVREVQIASVLFESMEGATSFKERLESGADFDALAGRLVQEGSAVSRTEGDYLEASKLQPAVAEVVLGLEVGAVGPPVQLPAGVTVMKLLDVRYPESPEARARAEQAALATQQRIELSEYVTELRSTYAEVDQELLGSLDFDAPGAKPEDFLNDERVVCKIKGGKPIMVKELTERLGKKMFHGIERAMAQKRVNEAAAGVLENMIQERATLLEAKRLGIEGRPRFRSALRARRDGVIFGKFVSKVIDPNVKLSDEEVQAFYTEHASEYSTPQMMRLESLVFQEREDAQAALQKLRQGADLKWMRANAVGQVDPEEVNPEWRFGGRLLPLPGLPESAQDALAGASSGDFRFCEESAGNFHVLRVVQSFPSEPREYEDVKKVIGGRVFAKKRQEALDHWLDELRKASEIKVRIDSGELKDLLGLRSEEDG